MRRVCLKTILALACLGASAAALYWCLLFSAPERRNALLILLSSVFVFGVIGGYLVGRILGDVVRRGGKSTIIVFVYALVGGVVLFGFLSSVFGCSITEDRRKLALLGSAAIALVVAHGYVSGLAFVPGGTVVPRRRRVLVIVLLYGSVLSAAAVHRIFPWPWTKVPLASPRIRMRPAFDEFLERVRADFPWDVQLIERPDGRTEVDYTVPRRPLYRNGISDRVIAAEGPHIDFPEGEVEVIGMDIASQDPGFIAYALSVGKYPGPVDGDELDGFRRLGVWKLDGTPIPEEHWPPDLDIRAHEVLTRGAFFVRVRGDLDFWPTGHYLILLPDEVSVASFTRVYEIDDEDRAGAERLLALNFLFGPLIPGPVELRMVVVRAEERRASLPNVPGEVLHMERNSLHLVGVWEGGFQLSQSRSRSPDKSSQNIPKLRPLEEYENVEASTAVFLSILHAYRVLPVTIQAKKTNGTLLDASDIERVGHRITVIFPCRPEEIAEFVIVERPALTEIRFPVSDIAVFPPENHGLENLLDLRVPYLIRDYSDLCSALGGGDMRDQYTCHTRFCVRSPLDPYRMPALREILSHHYPGEWRVRYGTMEFGVGGRTLWRRLGRAWGGGAGPPRVPEIDWDAIRTNKIK